MAKPKPHTTITNPNYKTTFKEIKEWIKLMKETNPKGYQIKLYK